MQVKHKKNKNKRVFFAVLVFVLLLIGFLFFKFGNFFKPVYEYTFNRNIELKKTETQKINLLLLGIGGGTHDGPLLTDTMIFASIDPQTKKVTLISIPRDFWIANQKTKINTIYAYAEEKEKGSGLKKTEKVVGDIIGQPIDYGFRIDFNGFIKAVDMVGGIDVNVDRTFDDYEYPVPSKENDDCGFKDEEFEKRATAEAQLEAFPCRYQHLHFEQGLTHMDGETALTFVRSRHALGPEGTDFSRSKRQEKIINAFKDKVFAVETILNPVKIINLLAIFSDSIDTDIKENEIDDFVKLAQKMQKAKIESFVLDMGDENSNMPRLLTSPQTSEEFKYQWVIVPTVGVDNYSEIQEFVTCLIKAGIACIATPTPTTAVKSTKYQ